MTALLAAQTFKDNAQMIQQCAEIGYLRSDALTIDPTYGKGNWWTRWRPDELLFSDIALNGIDFRDLPLPDNCIEQGVFDPPYVAKGGRKTSNMQKFDAAYGLFDAPKTPLALQILINEGLDELMRVLVPKATLIVKCQNYVSSGKLWLGREHTLGTAMDFGFTVQDILEYIVESPRPQPKRTHKGPDGTRLPSKQKHFQRNLSTALVLRAPK